MKRIKFLLRTSLILGLQFGLLLSCKDSREAQPFPTSEHEYKSPITRHIALSKADTLNWASSQLRSFNSLPIKKFNFNKLPSKPFDIGEPFDFTPSRPDQDLDWDRLPSRAFDFDSLPMESIEFKTIVLGAPSIVKAGVPERALDASRGVMTFDGYPGTILCQMIDQDGMIWIGGSSGIARFDAEELQLYDQGQGLKSNTIFSIYQDSKGRIWTGDSEGSISIIDLKANLIYELSSLRTFNPIYDITEAKDGKFWLSSTGKGYGIIDLADMSLRTFSEEQGLLDKMSVVPMQDAEGLIWLTTGKGVNIVDPV
jgi:hypothetical protein